MFKLKSKYTPSWDQRNAIKEIVEYIKSWEKCQTLWWVTWSVERLLLWQILYKK